tara:strand:- start:23 stop:466 length:444 start_codon:yes stop_codon:yes gene_type:complete
MYKYVAPVFLLVLTACGGGAGSSSAPDIPSGLDSKKLYLFHRLGGIEGVQDLKKKSLAMSDPESVDLYWRCGLKAIGKKVPSEILEVLTREYKAKEDLIAREINRPTYKDIVAEVSGYRSGMDNRDKTNVIMMEGALERCKRAFEDG